MDPTTARRYLGLQRLPSELKRERTWRTREDPFGEVWEAVQQQIKENPGLEAKTLFEWLQREYPGRFSDGQIRTLQRRIKLWRGPMPGDPDWSGDSPLTMHVVLGAGDGTFSAPAVYPAQSSESVAIGDVNGDGVLDIVTDSVTILYGVTFQRGVGPPRSDHESMAPSCLITRYLARVRFHIAVAGRCPV
jgi:hypothetical protein